MHHQVVYARATAELLYGRAPLNCLSERYVAHRRRAVGDQREHRERSDDRRLGDGDLGGEVRRERRHESLLLRWLNSGRQRAGLPDKRSIRLTCESGSRAGWPRRRKSPRQQPHQAAPPGSATPTSPHATGCGGCHRRDVAPCARSAVRPASLHEQIEQPVELLGLEIVPPAHCLDVVDVTGPQPDRPAVGAGEFDPLLVAVVEKGAHLLTWSRGPRTRNRDIAPVNARRDPLVPFVFGHDRRVVCRRVDLTRDAFDSTCARCISVAASCSTRRGHALADVGGWQYRRQLRLTRADSCSADPP